MVQFKNMLQRLSSKTKINFKVAVHVRRVKMEQEGFNTDYVNWDHYAKVLEAKQARLASA